MAKKPLNAPQSRIHESEPMVIEIEVEDATVAILEAISSSFKFQDIYLGELGTFRSLLVSKASPISSQRVKVILHYLQLPYRLTKENFFFIDYSDYSEFEKLLSWFT